MILAGLAGQEFILPVIVNRLAVALWVFIFGIPLSTRMISSLGDLVKIFYFIYALPSQSLPFVFRSKLAGLYYWAYFLI